MKNREEFIGKVRAVYWNIIFRSTFSLLEYQI